MKVLVSLAVLIVAALHVGFLTLEMFYWDHPLGRNIFVMTADESAFSATLAANQGFYNGILAAGLLWGLVTRRADFLVFFLLAVIAAGVFGGATAKPSIYFLQALPGLLALIVVLVAMRASNEARARRSTLSGNP